VQSLSTIRALLASRGLHPKHRFGQNFLHDHNLLRKLVAAAEIAPGELVLEVGPGTGTLTEALLEHGAEVVACELDPEMAEIVASRVGDRITLVRGDCLDGKRALNPALLAALGDRPFVLVANLPYGAATPLMATLLVEHERCRGLFVTVQREVADRLAAPSGGKTYGPLSVIAQALAEVELISVLPGSCFWPPPDVTSAMIALRRRSAGAIAAEHGSMTRDERAALAAFASKLFATRRKQLGTILGKSFPFPEGIDSMLRPEMLPPHDVIRMWRAEEASGIGSPRVG
jgi:16S rRNA (adenine1518-N6/adenine1519-N6)-dimethyltransferase